MNFLITKSYKKMIPKIDFINKKINSENVLRKITKKIIPKTNIATSQNLVQKTQIFIYTTSTTTNFTQK